MMVAAINVIEERLVLAAAAQPGGLVLPDDAVAFEPVHISLWRLGFVRLFSPRFEPWRVVATAAGLRAIGAMPEPLRVVR